MGWRFRKSISLMPGVRLNLSKTGISASAGVKGAHVTIGHDRVTQTVSIPGTGVSYSSTDKMGSGPIKRSSLVVGLIVIVVVLITIASHLLKA